MTDRFTRWTLRAGALFVIALAAWSRATLRAAVFIDGETYPLDTDCHYHLRRALRTLEYFPRVPVRDPWINWPHGATPTWGPGFDQLLALPAWLAGAAGDLARASRIIAWVPFALGLFVVVATMYLARALDPDEGDRDATALAAGAFAATLPIASLTSMAGRVDHHVFEALTTALVALWLARPPALRAPWRFEIAGALAVFFTVHTFTGTLLQWGLAAAALAARALFDDTSPRSPRESVPGSGAVALTLGGALVALCDLGWIREQGDLFHHLQLSFLQPLVLVGGGISVGTLAAVSGKVAPRGTWPTATELPVHRPSPPSSLYTDRPRLSINSGVFAETLHCCDRKTLDRCPSRRCGRVWGVFWSAYPPAKRQGGVYRQPRPTREPPQRRS